MNTETKQATAIEMIPCKSSQIAAIGHDCAACATREKHITKLKQDIERWKSRATTYKKKAEQLREKQPKANP